MTRKYKDVRMPLEAYKNFMVKKERMENVIKKITNKLKYKIPLTKVFIITSKTPITIHDENLINLVKKKKR